jgi:nucleotide-binding universal stress UspA family protein
MFPKKNVVVPIDFSTESKHAIETALELTDSPTHIHLVHILFPLDVMIPGVVWTEVDNSSREISAREAGQKFVRDSNLPEGMTFLVRMGDPGTEIALYANSINSELIIIPSHGYHGLKRLLLGSVTEHVIRHANCPVLVLRRSDAETNPK